MTMRSVGGLTPPRRGSIELDGKEIATIKHERAISILVSEQNALFALHLADRGYILEKGRIQHQASAEELAGSREIRTYLGVQERGTRRPRAAGTGSIQRGAADLED